MWTTFFRSCSAVLTFDKDRNLSASSQFVLDAAPPNFVKISGAHRMTPPMAAGVGSRLWEVSDIVKVVEAWEAALG